MSVSANSGSLKHQSEDSQVHSMEYMRVAIFCAE
jgi:hypothetical protein